MSHNHLIVYTASGGRFFQTPEVEDADLLDELEKAQVYYGTLTVRIAKDEGHHYQYRSGGKPAYVPVLQDADGKALWRGTPVTQDRLPGLAAYWEYEYENMTVGVERCDEEHIDFYPLEGSVRAASAGLPTLGRRRR